MHTLYTVCTSSTHIHVHIVIRVYGLCQYTPWLIISKLEVGRNSSQQRWLLTGMEGAQNKKSACIVVSQGALCITQFFTGRWIDRWRDREVVDRTIDGYS